METIDKIQEKNNPDCSPPQNLDIKRKKAERLEEEIRWKNWVYAMLLFPDEVSGQDLVKRLGIK